jgi:hypothetical protein
MNNFKVGATILGGELPIWTSTCRIARYGAWDFGGNSKVSWGRFGASRSTTLDRSPLVSVLCFRLRGALRSGNRFVSQLFNYKSGIRFLMNQLVCLTIGSRISTAGGHNDVGISALSSRRSGPRSDHVTVSAWVRFLRLSAQHGILLRGDRRVGTDMDCSACRNGQSTSSEVIFACIHNF